MANLKIKRAPAVTSNDRAWSQVYDDINEIIKSVNKKSENEGRTKGSDGNDGDVRLFKDNNKAKYFIEGKFNDGWAKRELLFSDNDDASQDESINFSATESYVKPDGTVPFTSTIIGVAPSNDLHLATKKYVDDLSATKDTLSELTDTNLSTTNGDMIKYDSDSSKWISFAANFLTSYAVNDSYTGSSLNPTVFGLKQTGTSSITTLRGVRSANSNMTITLEESLSGAYLKFNVASPTGIQSVTGYNVGGGGYGSTITGNTGLKIADDYDSGTSTGIFFEVTDSGNDTIVTPSIVGALTDTNYYVDSLAWNTGNGVLTVGRSGVADLTIDLDGRYPTSDTNTTYTTSWVDSGDNAILRLTAGNTGTGNDDLTLVAGDNIALTPSGDNLTIAANNTTNYSLVNSTGNPSGSHVLVMTSSGTEGRLRAIKPGDNITMSTTDSDTDTAYVTINASLSNATINVSEVNPLGGYLTYDSANIRFIDNGRITWSLGRPGSNVTTVTPTITNPSAADVGAIATSHAANSITSTHITVLGNTSGTNSGDQTIPTRDSLGIDTNDTVRFGSVEVDNDLWINGYSDITASRIRFHHNGSNAYQDWETGNYYIRYDTTTKYMMDSSGNFHADADVYAYSTSVGSDKKLKKNIKDIKYGLKDVLKLRGVDFDWKEKRNKAHDIGVIAQEIQEVVPEVVMEVEDLNGEDTHLTVDYAKLVPVLIEAIKELKKEIDNGFCKCK